MFEKLRIRRSRLIEELACERADEILDEALAAGLSVAREEMARQYEEQIAQLEARLESALEVPVRRSISLTASWRTELPPGSLLQGAVDSECPDCTAEIVVFEREDVEGLFDLVVVHDQTCPWSSPRGPDLEELGRPEDEL